VLQAVGQRSDLPMAGLLLNAFAGSFCSGHLDLAIFSSPYRTASMSWLCLDAQAGLALPCGVIRLFAWLRWLMLRYWAQSLASSLVLHAAVRVQLLSAEISAKECFIWDEVVDPGLLPLLL